MIFNHPSASKEQSRAMAYAVAVQCCYAIAFLAFSNNFLLVYFKSLGMDEVRILYLLSLEKLLSGGLMIPAAFLCERFGIKRVCSIGMVILVVGFACLTLAGWLPEGLALDACLLGVVLFGVGVAVSTSGWFALLSPIVPEEIRGRFFGFLRFSWLGVGLLFSALIALLLSDSTPRSVYQGLLVAMTVALIARIYFYTQVPELDKPVATSGGFFNICLTILRTNGIMAFCAYTFLLTLFTASGAMLFGMVEKTLLNFGENTIVWLGNITTAGMIAGNLLGGPLVDRWGTKPAFIVCHLGYGLLFFAFVGRVLMPNEIALMGLIGLVHFMFGVFVAVSSVAITTEILGLIPAENKALSTSILNTMRLVGTSLSSGVAAAAIQMGFLRSSWQAGAYELSNYDTVIIVYGGMVVMLVFTLGLIPSVLHKSEFVPNQP